MLSSSLLERPVTPDPELVTSGRRPQGYLEMFNLFRVVACLAVLGQHSFIWANMSDNFVGTGFITVLHLSRTCFFFLTGLVVCYAQITHPRPLLGFWKRRYWEVGVPYLAWTGIYLIFTLITVDASWNEAGAFLRHAIPFGFSQMYFVIVIFQFYLLFPLLLKLVRSTRHHGVVMATSVALALAIGFFSHYPTLFHPGNDVTHAINTAIPVTRDFLSYQEFFIAGMLVALHLDQIVNFVARRYRRNSGRDCGLGCSRGGVVHDLGVERRVTRPCLGLLPTERRFVVHGCSRGAFRSLLVVGPAHTELRSDPVRAAGFPPRPIWLDSRVGCSSLTRFSSISSAPSSIRLDFERASPGKQSWPFCS